MNAAYWKRQKVGDPHGPDKYAELQPESYPMLEAIKKVAPDHEASILDVGCNVGRHIKALRDHGYRQVWGIDVRSSDDRNVITGTFEELLPLMHARWFDVVFTFGMTIELIPFRFPICHDLARVAKYGIVLAVHEVHAPYCRKWKKEFEHEGFTCTRYQNPIMPGSQLSLFVFEKNP